MNDRANSLDPILPSEFLPYEKKARQGLEAGWVKEIAFSGKKYQILVEDPENEEEYWVLLQFDSEGHVEDLLCFCEEAEEMGCCVHSVMAFLRIAPTGKEPLHKRFLHSFWNALGQQLCQSYGDEEGILQKNEERRSFSLPNEVFRIEVKNDETWNNLITLIEDRGWETEENSIKFSNFSDEDIDAWRRGNPPFLLQYELSVWADLAKEWLLRQEAGEEAILSFTYDEKKIPDQLFFSFADMYVTVSLPPSLLAALIPTFPTVSTPFIIEEDKRESLQEAEYDMDKGLLHLRYGTPSSDERERKKEGGISLGEWLFFPDNRFVYSSRQEINKKVTKGGAEIGHFLNEFREEIAPLLRDVPIHDVIREVQYSISFDTEWRLHLIAYIGIPGDLQQPYSRILGDWVYIEKKGFFPIHNWRFTHVHTIIPAYQVANFVRQHRAWLNTQEGFQTHIVAVQEILDFEVSSTGRLRFYQKEREKKREPLTKDFGPYVYVEGEGFYTKVSAEKRFLIRPGIVVSPEQIPLFITTYQEDLKNVPGFFSPHCPVEKAYLSMHINPKEEIEIQPRYVLDPKATGKALQFFEEFAFVPEEGFSLMEGESLLPEGFRHIRIFPPEEHATFFSEILPKIDERILYRDPTLQRPQKFQLQTKQMLKRTDTKVETYSLQLDYQTEWGRISLWKLWRLLHSKRPFAFTEAGMLDLTDPRFLWVRKLKEGVWEKKSQQLLVTPLQLIRIHAIEPFSLCEEVPQAEESRRFLQEMTHFETSQRVDKSGLLSHLRPYQTTGLQWLWFLYQYRLAGLLCDEMGLGKTHQAMALMAAVRNSCRQKEEATPPKFLVVCPTSVLYHWKEKIEEFFPSLRVRHYYGIKRSLDGFVTEEDLLLTSYGTLRNDQESLAQIPFEVAFFDEVQTAKNVQSMIYRALRRIQARSRYGLTGTPIENHLRELKTLFDLVLPTYMPPEKEYRELFIKPIEREKKPEAMAMLSRFIHPFVLRRRKKDVLTDLPAKIEEVSHCDLLDDQERLYRKVLSQGREQLFEDIQDLRRPIPYLHVFALLTHLKQICDHPAVYLKEPMTYEEHSSGKWELFKELLSEALESEQKVVVYTQYLHMLDILEHYLKSLGISYASIRGATADRGRQVSRFQNDPDCHVFVGSLQAAGLGIDLTAASVVIHYDRWWNAARENQATDRVHRIGQKRGVSVFKLVTLGTFEERIDFLIEKKRRLLEEIVGIDDANVIKQFTRDEILELLQDG